MSPNTVNNMTENLPPVYAGLDIAKAALQLHFQDHQQVLPNTAKGHARLIQLLRAVPGSHLICEATGGYERAVVAALHAAQLPVSVVNPAQVRHFALAQGGRAKNDPLDAAVLTAFGQALKPAPTPMADADLAELRGLIQWRDQLKEQVVRARQYSEHATLGFAQRQQAKLVKHLEQQIAAVEKELAAALARAPRVQDQVHALAQLDGVGTLTAVSVLSQMPELGLLNRQQTAALAGLAPVDQTKRPLGRPTPHRRRTRRHPPRALHERRGTGAPNQNDLGTILPTPALGRQTGQSRPDRRHAQTAPPNESNTQSPCAWNRIIYP